jgi:spore germination protein GerM
MRRIQIATIWIALLAVTVGVIVLWGNETIAPNQTPVRHGASEAMRPTVASGRKSISLFFVTRGGTSFHEEAREIEGGTTTTEDAKQTLDELVKGPIREGLVLTIPRGAKLLNLFIDSSGTAYVDFNRALRDGLQGGAQGELYTVFSIVNTLVSNFVRITRVQLLVEGAEIPTLAGHVDTRVALTPQYVF